MDRRVGLCEIRKQASDPVRRDADAQIPDRDAHRCADRAALDAARRDDNVTGLSEFHRIAGEVEDDLANAARIADQRLRQFGVDVDAEPDPLLHSALGNNTLGIVDDGFDRERHRFEFQLTGVELRKIEDVVQDGQQPVARLLDGFGRTALVVVEVQFKQAAGEPKHGVHRRADLVTHHREEFGARARSRFGDVTRRRQCSLVLLALGDVGVGAHEPAVRERHRADLEHGPVTPPPFVERGYIVSVAGPQTFDKAGRQ